MLVYTFDNTLDGLLTAVFDCFFLHQQPEMLLAEGEQLPLFADEPYRVNTNSEKAARVWKGLEKHLSKEGLRMITISWLSEERALNQPLFNFVCKVFKPHPPTPAPRGEGVAFGREGSLNTQLSLEQNASDPDVLAVRNTCRRVLHEQLRMKQFIRFQKAKDGTYLAVVSPDHNVLPLIIDHFQDRFNDQPWLIYDAKRHYGYYYSSPTPSPSREGEGSICSPTPNPSREGEGSIYSQGGNAVEEVTTPLSPARGVGGEAFRVTLDESSIPFNLANGKLDADVLSSDDALFQQLWRTYFKAICIRERINPKKQLSDMPRRYWKYMTEKNG